VIHIKQATWQVYRGDGGYLIASRDFPNGVEIHLMGRPLSVIRRFMAALPSE
jgi:hypothetical protein